MSDALHEDDRRKVWKLAWADIAAWSQTIKALPPDDVILRKTTIAVRKAGYPYPHLLSHYPSIASEIASYFITNFDPLKRRAPPKTVRQERELRNDQIVAGYLAAQEAKLPISQRQLAKRFGLTSSQVGRILRDKAKYANADHNMGRVLTDVAQAVSLVEQLMPRDGIKAIRASELNDLLKISSGCAAFSNELMQELGSLLPQVHFYRVDNHFVISRGRRLDEAKAKAWFVKARPSSLLSPRRDFFGYSSAVWQDLLAAQAVCLQQASADDWSVFINAFTLKSAHLEKIKSLSAERSGHVSPIDFRYSEQLICDDPTALVARIRTSLRYRSDRGYTHSIRARNQEYVPWHSTLNQILYWIEYNDGKGLEAIAQLWIAVSCYRLRIDAGLLPGRSASHIAPFINAARSSDDEDVPLSISLEEFRRGDEG